MVELAAVGKFTTAEAPRDFIRLMICSFGLEAVMEVEDDHETLSTSLLLQLARYTIMSLVFHCFTFYPLFFSLIGRFSLLFEKLS